MTTTEWLTAITALMALIQALLLAAALVVYWLQLKAYRDSYGASNLLRVWEHLNSEHARAAKRTVLSRLKDLPRREWIQADETAAATVCGIYDLAGLVAEQGLVSFDLIAKEGATSLVRCHAALAEYLKEMRKTNGESYWGGFTRLAKRAEHFYKPPVESESRPA